MLSRRPHFLRVAQALALVGEAAFGAPCPPPICICPVAACGDAETPGLASDGALTGCGTLRACTDPELARGCQNETPASGPLPPPELAA